LLSSGQSSAGFGYFYHNTLRSAFENCFSQTDPGLSNIISRNNVYRSGRYIIEFTSTPADGFDLNYYLMCTAYPTRYIKWENAKVDDLFAFRMSTGLAKNSNSTNPDLEFQDTDGSGFKLVPGSFLIDKGQVLLGFNDKNSAWPFVNRAPDMGAWEDQVSQPVPPLPPVPPPAPTGTSLPSGAALPTGAPTNQNNSAAILNRSCSLGISFALVLTLLIL